MLSVTFVTTMAMSPATAPSRVNAYGVTNPWAGDDSDVGSAEGRSPSGPPAPVNLDTSSVSGSQAFEGVPCGQQTASLSLRLPSHLNILINI